MSILKVENDFLKSDPCIKEEIYRYFDIIIPDDILSSNLVTTFRVEKFNEGLFLADNTEITITLASQKHSLFPGNREITIIKVVAVNDVTLDPTNYSEPLPLPGSIGHIKSKG